MEDKQPSSRRRISVGIDYRSGGSSVPLLSAHALYCRSAKMMYLYRSVAGAQLYAEIVDTADKFDRPEISVPNNQARHSFERCMDTRRTKHKLMSIARSVETRFSVEME
jgi:hypothetical protein